MLRTDADDSVLVAVRVKPRSSREKIAGERADRLLVEVTAPPLEDRANVAVCRLIARTLDVSPSRVSVKSGARSRDKLIRVDGLALIDIAERLAQQ
jgi:uncharacterized protein (TIGR00251 family)